MFEEDRLQAEAARYQGESVEELVNGILSSVRRFAGGMPQNDDITILAFTYQNTENEV